MTMARALLGGIAGLLLGCGDEPAGTRVRMDFTLPEPFAAPWPNEARRGDDGRVRVGDFPNPRPSRMIEQIVALVEADARGFATSAGVFFALDGALDGALADGALAAPADSLADDAPVFVVPIVAGVAGAKHPVEVEFRAHGGPFGAPNLLSVLPLQGLPLAPATLYAAVVRTSLADAAGRPLAASPAIARLAAGGAPAGMSEPARARYAEAIAALAAAGVPAGELAGLAVFETDDPAAVLARVYDDALARPLPAPDAPLALTDVFDELCVYAGTIALPVYQHGELPYATEGGGFAFDATGAPRLYEQQTARVVVTLPRRAMPSGGFPAVLFSRTGAGGDRPLVDRGVRDASGEVIEPGSGLARDFAAVGFAGVSVDGPHGGPRNPTGGDEQFLMFNVNNPTALRDNVRQAALELALDARALAALAIPRGACDGIDAGEVRLDATRLALFGHSMGATIAPLAMHLEPRLAAVVLSGGGGSYIANVLHKQKPLVVRGALEILLGTGASWELHAHDPALSLLQWAAEPADPPLYAGAIAASGRHALMLQGIIDHYILPPIANPLALALGADLAGPALDAAHPDLAAYTPLAAHLPFAGGQPVGYPVEGNRAAGAATVVVVQHAEDGVEDGHEAVFQTAPPKAQLRCFLRTLAAGTPRVIAPGAACDP